jgi:hypothetical protein
MFWHSHLQVFGDLAAPVWYRIEVNFSSFSTLKKWAPKRLFFAEEVYPTMPNFVT